MTSSRPACLSRMRSLLAMAMLAGLAACATPGAPHIAAVQEARQYEAKASHSYAAPGSPEDPWGPYVTEASKRFDVPERWIREVMRQESGGRLFMASGGLTTSSVGAMGLMQVMPGTYDILKDRYSLGDDPYDPHNNILAGAAYIREMYDLYGSPGFLAAYNAGPGRLDDYLTRNRPLPAETRHYVAAIGPYIADSSPVNRSPVEQYAMNALPTRIPSGPRYPDRVADEETTEVAYAPEPRAVPRPETREAHSTLPTPPASHLASTIPLPPTPPSAQMAQINPRTNTRGLHLIHSAMAAEPLPIHHGGAGADGGWAIQVGAYGNATMAHAAASAARQDLGRVATSARPVVGSVTQGRSTLFRARVTGLSRDAASEACHKLAHHGGCIVLSPEAQS